MRNGPRTEPHHPEVCVRVRRARVGDGGALEPLEVQPPGGRPMPYADYVRGHGERFRSA